MIVGILVAYIVKTKRHGYLKPLWSGVAIAVVASIALGAFLTLTSVSLSERGEELFAGVTSFIAVALVTWMVFWMKRTARHLKGELEGKVEAAATVGPIAIAAAAFFAVIREGVETSVFLWSSSRAAGDDTNPVLGATLGLLVAAGLGYLIYRGALKLNISKFFKYTGAFLIVVAAGILAYGVHELQDIGWFPFLTDKAYDVSGIIPKDSFVDVLLRGTVSFRSSPAILETIVWFAYLIPVTYLYLKPAKKVAA